MVLGGGAGHVGFAGTGADVTVAVGVAGPVVVMMVVMLAVVVAAVVVLASVAPRCWSQWLTYRQYRLRRGAVGHGRVFDRC